jgi:hypothetical protein
VTPVYPTADGAAPVAGLGTRRIPPAGGVAGALGRGAPGITQGLIVVGALALWIVSLRAVDLHRISDLGIVPALPAGAFAALAIVTAGFAVALRRPVPSTPLVLLHLVAIVVMLHGTTTLIDPEPAFNVVWRHAGVTDFVLSTGRVDPSIDAYFNWPGFFFLTGLATRAAGLDSALGLSGWAPVVFELTYLPGLVVIARTFTTDRRLSWVAVWLFYVTNWVGQDYLSPQAMAYVLYLAVVAIVLTCFTRTAAPELGRLRARGASLLVRVRARRPGIALHEPPAGETITPRQRGALVLVCTVLIAAAVGSHQLTPWMLLASLVLLVGLRRCTARGLPVITLVLLVVWMTYLAAAYLNGHLKPLLGQTLDVQGAVAANVSGRLQGSANHLLVVRLRLVMTALIWGLAVVGAVRGLRRGWATPSHAILALAPAALAVLQPYGGEMLMRVYLFSLPFAACYAAIAITPSPAWRGWWVSSVLAVAGLVLVGGFLFTRYGNERTTLFTSAEVRAVDHLYALAPPGATLVAVSTNVPWKQRHYADYRYQLLARQLHFPGGRPGPRRLADEIADYMANARSTHGRAYLIITRSQKVYDTVLGAQPWGSASDIERAVEQSPRFRKVFDDGDGRIFVIAGHRAEVTA